MKTYEYVIRSAGDARLSAYEGTVYATQDEAEQAVKRALGWKTLAVSDAFATDNGEAVCLYETDEECEADQEGAHAPRIECRAK